MSFIEELNKKRNSEKLLEAQANQQPINMFGAMQGLASTANMRDPYRVNGPINSVTTPSNRSRMLYK
jgi:hypothetical protein